MWRLLCVLTVVSACFNPGGGGESSSASASTSTATATSATTSDPPPTTPTSTGDGPTGATDPTTNPAETSTTSDPTVPGETTDDVTTTTTTMTSMTRTTDDTTTMPVDCEGGCPQCQACMQGQCKPANIGMDCTPDPAACTSKIAAMIDGTCHAGQVDSAVCDADGTCAVTCEPGEIIATCASSLCVRDPTPCIPGNDIVTVTKTNLCFLDEPSDDCKTVCVGDDTEASYCDETAACVGGLILPCEPYKCDVNLGQCYIDCLMGQGCYGNHMCVQGMCT